MAALMTTSVLFTSIQPTDIQAASRNVLYYTDLSVPKKTAFYEGLKLIELKDTANKSYSSTSSKINGFSKCNNITINTNGGDINVGETFDIELKDSKFFFRNSNSSTISEEDRAFLKDNDLEDFTTTEATEDFHEYNGATYDTGKGTYLTTSDNRSTPGIYLRYNSGDNVNDFPYDYSMKIFDDKNAEVTLQKLLKHSDSSSNSIVIPLVTRIDEKIGSSKSTPIKVSMSGQAFTNSELTYATVTDGSTTLEIDSDDIETGSDEFNIPEIKIKENIAGTFSSLNSLKFTLDLLEKGYEFDSPVDNEVEARINGQLVTLTSEQSNNGRSIKFTLRDITPNENNTKQTIKISGLKIYSTGNSTSNNSHDIKLRLTDSDNQGFTETEFVAAKYSLQSLSVEVESEEDDNQVPTLINGINYDYEGNERNETANLILKELTSDTLKANKNLIFTFPSKVKVRGLEIVNSENLNDKFAGTIYEYNQDTDAVYFDSNKVTLKEVKKDRDDKLELELIFYLQIESGFEGDVTVNISGTSLGNLNTSEIPSDIVVAKSVNLLKSNDVKINFTPGEIVSLNDITLTENTNNKGETVLESDDILNIYIKNSNNYFTFIGEPKIETTSGDLKAKNLEIQNDDKELVFEIDESSFKGTPSTLTISGLKVSSASNTPKGTYELRLSNGYENYIDVKDSSNKNNENYTILQSHVEGIKIATLQYGEGKIDLKLTVGDDTAEVNGETVKMQYAPFIEPSTGTTYMQVSDIARLLGLQVSFFDNRIEKLVGLADSLFVTLGNRTFEIGKSAVRVDGNSIPETMTNEQNLAVPALIKNDYTCLPIRYFVEKVLNQKITWNSDDNTILVE
jgi:hypothetical protein